jgi:hypothetical protein
MKFLNYILFLIIGISLFSFLFGCKEDQALILVSEYTVKITMPENIKEEYKYADKTVILRSQRMTYTTNTDQNGIAVFKDIIPDIYNISTSWDVNSDEYINMSDTLVENRPALISGIASSKRIFKDSIITIPTLLSIKQSLIISKVYASGTKDLNNAKYDADVYVEIFNNSDEIQFIDGIYLALVEGDSSIAFAAKDNPTNIHARQVFRFPGDGTKYPILPGQSIVACNSAVNHTANALFSVNLQNADFEFKNTISKPTNNPNVDAMILIHTSYVSLNSLNLQRGGVNSICLFKTTEDVTNYSLDYPPGKTSGNRFLRIPAKYVLDGVEILGYKSTGVDINSKRLQSFIDAGYKTISSTSGNSHESIERKVDKSRSNNNRIYLIDTNNSQTDMALMNDPTQKKYDKALLLE